VDLFNNPVGCLLTFGQLASLADLVGFLQKSAKSAVFFSAEVVQ
jgi:hypothetical protein